MLPAVLEMFTIVFFLPFSRRGRKACETCAEPATLVLKVLRRVSTSPSKAESSRMTICIAYQRISRAG